MSENKTRPTKASVDKFLRSVKDEKRRKDCYKVLDMMRKLTKEEPKMWGPAIVGSGSYHYKYPSGREGDMPLAGFSPRKQALTVYVMCRLGKSAELMKKLGKYKSGAWCLYIKSLEDIDMKVLKELVTLSYKEIRKKKGD